MRYHFRAVPYDVSALARGSPELFGADQASTQPAFQEFDLAKIGYQDWLWSKRVNQIYSDLTTG